MKERKEKELCWFCDKKYHLSNTCNKSKIYLLEGMEGEEEEIEEIENKEGVLAVIETNEVEIGELLRITLLAMTGS